ncbi:carboxysome shell carbonic anhydrase [Pelomicrobium methylotrophicum]|nr:carboxysome shell carbonic anhydrase [Pelomicrobium methylotrophicum]
MGSRARHVRRLREAFGGAIGHGTLPRAVTDPYHALFGRAPVLQFAAQSPGMGAHPLHDATHNRCLLEREAEIVAAFEAIEPALKEIAAMQWQDGFAERAQSLALQRLGFTLPRAWLVASWTAPLDMRRLYAYAVFRTFRTLAERNFDRSLANHNEGEPADALIRRWGFHAIDITPCADGRLSGVVDYILRVPPAVVVHRKSYAGSMFDIEESMRHWAEVELRRHREGLPNRADEPTRYLKIGVYHTSGSDPGHEGCAAHGSDERRAASALLERLDAFRKAIENSFCCGASVATLLIGVDTDTDAIRVHVPDAEDRMSLERYVDNARLYEATRALEREAAKEAIRLAVAECAGVPSDDAATEGMRWFCAYLLKNNMAQIEYVRAYHNGRYTDLGHTERFITVGDSFDDVQMRNLAYQAQMDTVEEGASDLDIGIKIFTKLNVARGLPIPVIVHFRYDAKVPGSRERAVKRGQRLEAAIRERYAQLVREGLLYTFVTVKDSAVASRLEDVGEPNGATEDHCACGCDSMEARS